MLRTSLSSALLLIGAAAQAASITDFRTWTPIADPVHPGMSGMVTFIENDDLPAPALVQLARLSATGAIPSGTDIGYASISGDDVAGSTGGYYFDPAFDFSVAVDFNFTGKASTGAGGLGFGIGEDIDGTDSAGIGLGFLNGAAVLFATAGRVDDVDQAIESIVSGFGSGRLFVEYDSVTGDVMVGVNASQGTPAPGVFKTLAGIQKQWDDEPLLVSFFLRSQALDIQVGGFVPALSSGQVNATFSNFEVLSGTPIAIVPEPTTSLLAFLGALGGSVFWKGRFPRRC